MILSPDQCQATVYRRDQLRRTGRGKYGFEMHYTEDQCSRKRPVGSKYCWQHEYLEVGEHKIGEDGARA